MGGVKGFVGYSFRDRGLVLGLYDNWRENKSSLMNVFYEFCFFIIRGFERKYLVGIVYGKYLKSVNKR